MSLPGRVGTGRWYSSLAILPLLALLAHGCAPMAVAPGPSRTPPHVPPAGRPRAGYDRRVDALAAADTAALRGHRIALDPGHGGFFRGSLGVNGLTEAEVNLGVALQLRGLLEARGAIVFMTRTDDRDFLTPADSTLRSDLIERTRLANAFAPELFVSIHHNADARGAHDVNETQTYYKLGDEGASLDAAQSVHRFLVRNLGIDKHRISPGNYYVLRSSDGAGLLTEASYLTNPDVESKLALAAKQRLEAEALYLGLAHYFALPRPEIVAFDARRTVYAAPDTVFGDIAAPVLIARITGAYDDARLTLDGALLDGRREGERMVWTPAMLAAGPHTATLVTRLSGAATSRTARLAFRIQRPVNRLRLTVMPGIATEIVPVRVEPVDAFGLLTSDSLQVRVGIGKSAARVAYDTTVFARGGVAWAYVRNDRRSGITVLAQVERGAAESAVLVVPARSMQPPIRVSGFARAMPGDSALRDAPGSDQVGAWINRDGFAVVDCDSFHLPTVPTLPGYRPWAQEVVSGDYLHAWPWPWPPRFTAVAGGALIGKRITLDADGGGEADGGTGAGGTRAANLNLEVARALAGFLAAAGAEVRMTREGDLSMSEVERVQTSEAFHADRFLRIGHRAEPPMLGYYFSSAGGKRWAESTRVTLAMLGLPAPKSAEDAQYPLQQTSCPALYVSVARIDAAASETRLAEPAAVRAEAYALYLGLAREWAGDAAWAADSITVRDADGRPAAGAAVTLGGSITLLTDQRGIVRYVRTESGPMDLDIVHPRVREHRVLLDSSTGVMVTGARRP